MTGRPMGTMEFLESIVAVQTHIEDFLAPGEALEIDLGAERFIKKKVCEYLGLEVPRRRLCINTKGRIAMAKPQCPICGSYWMMENGSKKRVLNTLMGSQVPLQVQKYLCGDCGKGTSTPLDELVGAYKHFTKEITSLALMLNVDCQASTYETADIIEFVLGVRVDPTSVGRWAKEILDSPLEFSVGDEDRALSAIYHLDEQRIKLNGDERWRYALLDSEGTMLADAVRDDRKQDTIKGFLLETFPIEMDLDLVCRKNTEKGKDIYECVFITDLDDTYDAVLDELRREIAGKHNIPLGKIKIRHQLCIFHLFQHVTREFKKASGYNPFARKKLPDDLDKLRKELFSVFYHKTEKGAREAFDKIFERRWDYKQKVRKVIENIDKRWKDYIRYLNDPTIPKTNNLAEQYFSRTHPEKIKKLYKTKKTLDAHLKGLGLKNNLKGHIGWLSLIGVYASIFEIAALLGSFLK